MFCKEHATWHHYNRVVKSLFTCDNEACKTKALRRAWDRTRRKTVSKYSASGYTVHGRLRKADK